MVEVLRASGATGIAVSADEAQRLKFWSGRKNAFPASGRISPDYMCMDSTIPRKRLADILIAIAQMETKYGLRCCNVFHAGDGNLHPLILFDANDADQLHRAELFGADILETSVAMGGTVTGEHGVGVEKLSSMCVQFSPAERARMADVKHAFDPAGLEMMDKPMTAAVEDFVHAGYDLTAEAILLCESDGTAAEVEAEVARMIEVLEKAGATRLQASGSEAERLKFWSGRKNAFPASGRISPDYMCMDSTIPRKRLADILLAIQEMEKKYGLRCANVFHAGDGNLHPLILFDANNPDELDRTERFAGEVLEKCVAVGGTITGEHGVGVEKINQMCIQFGSSELATFHAIKRAFDEHGLLNPGKMVPTLHRCAEFGRMHVHAGHQRFPELPRF